MEWVDAFDSWEAYRSFVEQTQQSLYEELRATHEADGAAFETGDGTLVPGFSLGSASDAAEPPYRWWRPTVYDKFQSRERPFFHDDGVRNQYCADSHYPEDGPYREAAFFGCDNETLVEEYGESRADQAIRPPDDDRYLEYVWEAPWWASGCELLLDTVTAMTVLLDDLDPAVAEELFEHLGEADENDDLAARMFRDLVLDPTESALSDPLFVPEALDRIGEAYDDLAVLTVWGTADRQLAVPDDSLPDGRAQPRTWCVRPHEALSGLEWTLSEGEGTAVVTVDREHEVVTPAFQRVTPFRRGTVEECDEGFPAEPGEEVVVAAANVIEEVGDDRGPDGLTTRQREVLAAAEDDPAGLSDEQVDLLATLATAGEPGPREQAVEALGQVAVGADTEGRPVEALADAVTDNETAVATAALHELERAAAAEVPLDDSLDAVVTALERDGTLLDPAGKVLSTVAHADQTALIPFTDQLTDILDTYDDQDGADEDRAALAGVLEALAATDTSSDVVADVAGVVVSAAGSLDDAVARPARALLDQVEPETDAAAAIATGVEERLLDRETWEIWRSLSAGAVGMSHPGAVDGVGDRLASSLSRWSTDFMMVSHVEAIAWALGMLGTAAPERVPEAAADTLREISDYPETDVADPAAVALAAMGKPILDPATVAAITDTDTDRPKRRRVLVAATRQVGTADPELVADNDGVAWLARTAKEDTDERVRSASLDALVAIADSDPDTFETAASAVAEQEPDLAERIATDESLPESVRTAFAND